MRKLFLVGVRLLGIAIFFWAIIPFSKVLHVLFSMGRVQPQSLLFKDFILLLLILALGVFLVFSTNKIANFLRIPD
jgi:NADH:ubiquinone oxidoreductase subunit 2 (subunit N)